MSERPRRGCRAMLAATAGAALAAVLPAAAAPAPRLTYNASASAPVGFYLVAAARPLRLGDLVLVRIPEDAADLAAARGYLPRRVPAAKRVAGLAGDRICGRGRLLLINGRAAAARLPADGQGQPLPSWEGCRTLGPDEVFLLTAEVGASFDGRYFGPVDAESVLGRLVPLWTW